MFARVFFTSVVLSAVVTSASALPPKRMHYDAASPDEAYGSAEFEPEGSPSPLPPTAETVDPMMVVRKLACEPVVIHSFVMAWKSTMNGTRNHGLGESGFAVDRYMATLSIQGWREAAVNDLFIPADQDTIAVAHVHGRNADEHPARMDLQSRVPNFVISRDALYVTIPGTSRFTRVRGGVNDKDGWNQPCRDQTLLAEKR